MQFWLVTINPEVKAMLTKIQRSVNGMTKKLKITLKIVLKSASTEKHENQGVQ